MDYIWYNINTKIKSLSSNIIQFCRVPDTFIQTFTSSKLTSFLFAHLDIAIFVGEEALDLDVVLKNNIVRIPNHLRHHF